LESQKLKNLNMQSHQFNRSLFVLIVLFGSPVASAFGQSVVPVAGGKEEMSLFSLIVGGGYVMIPLAIASIVALTITIERFISLRRRKIIPVGFLSGLKERFKVNGDGVENAVEYCERTPGPVGSIFKAGILNLARGEMFVEKAIEDAGAREMDRMKRSLRGLSIIAAISPLLGLLGTVYGMISAFQASVNVQVGKAEVLAGGIYEALVTTATGLTIAIPVLLLFQYFSARVDKLVDEIDDMGLEFMEHYLARNAEREKPDREPAVAV